MKSPGIPPFMEKILLKIISEKYRDAVVGDFIEIYRDIYQKKGRGRAKAWLILLTLTSLPLFILQSVQWSMEMFKNYLKIVFRNIQRHKGYSFLNIFGLALGMAVFMIITLFVRNEVSYDKFHKYHSRIFRIVAGNPHDKNSYAGTPAPLGPLMLENFPEVINYVRIDGYSGVLKTGDKTFNERRILLADNSIFAIFTFPLIQGDPATALEDPNSIVITESMAAKYFENEEPLGKILNLNGEDDMLVTGVAKDVPEKSHFHFDFLIPFKKKANLENWGMWNYYTYLLLNDSFSSNQIKHKFDLWAKDHGLEDDIRGLYYQPMTQIHFVYNRSNLEPAFNGKYIKIFLAVAFVILILACINFMNLSTARSSQRAKEVGIKKTVGANPLSLVKQFISESILLALLAYVISVLLVKLTLPIFNNFTGRNLSLDFTDPAFILGIIGLILFTGIISGSYPAFVLSSFHPTLVLKGSYRDSARSLFRNALVIFQFTISVALIVCTLLIYKQMSFIQNTDIGLNKEHVVNIRLNRDLWEKTLNLKNEFLNIPGVISASANGYVPSNMNWHQSVWWRGQLDTEKTSMWIMGIDKDFTSTFKIKVKEGQEQIKTFQPRDDRYDYILNASALKQMGWESAVGKEFSHRGEENPGTVIGVTEDFNFRSLHHEVAPCVMVVRERSSQISLRIESNRLSETLSAIKEKWEKVVPAFEFDYYFLDDDFDKLYKSEIKLSQLLVALTTLSVIIACLGLFGLASFMAQQKTKEIGIRKVLGASVSRITLGLTKVFAKLVVISNLIAWPIAYYIIHLWLQNFAYHTGISLAIFLLSSLIAFVIAFLTISYQSIKAARSNPINSLRYE